MEKQTLMHFSMIMHYWQEHLFSFIRPPLMYIGWKRHGLLTDYAIAHFRDKKSGLFFYTSDVSENLIARKMELPDNVIPSSNSVMAEVLYLLGEYYSEDSYIQMSTSMLNQVAKDMTTVGPYYANWASLMGMISYQPYEVAIMGKDALEKGNKCNSIISRQLYLWAGKRKTFRCWRISISKVEPSSMSAGTKPANNRKRM